MSNIADDLAKDLEDISKSIAISLTIVRTIIIAFLMALPVMWLWNSIIPDVTKGAITELNFWQALGLNFLCNFMIRPQWNFPDVFAIQSQKSGV